MANEEVEIVSLRLTFDAVAVEESCRRYCYIALFLSCSLFLFLFRVNDEVDLLQSFVLW